MENIEQSIKNCNICGELIKPKVASFVKGKSTILVIGESPAKNGWIASGRAFYDVDGKVLGTGRVLENLLKICNLTLDDISFTECCKCHIADRKQLEQCSINCKKFLLTQVEKSNCDIILTMGIFPSQVLLNTKINKLKGIVGQHYDITINNVVKTVIPIYHPSPANPLGYKGNLEIFEKIKCKL